MRVLADLAFPPSCLSCDAFGHRFLCPACETRFERIHTACRACAMPRSRDLDACVVCAGAGFAFDAAHAVARYEDVSRAILMAYKLGGERRAAPAIAALMVPRLDPRATDVLTFVPTTGRSLAARGFNPAAELARHLGRATSIPARPLLRKVRETVDQADLRAAQRRRNQAGAYVPARPCTGHVVLVDDILTTGATADACARALRRGGAARVTVVVFARTP